MPRGTTEPRTSRASSRPTRRCHRVRVTAAYISSRSAHCRAYGCDEADPPPHLPPHLPRGDEQGLGGAGRGGAVAARGGQASRAQPILPPVSAFPPAPRAPPLARRPVRGRWTRIIFPGQSSLRRLGNYFHELWDRDAAGAAGEHQRSGSGRHEAGRGPAAATRAKASEGGMRLVFLLALRDWFVSRPETCEERKILVG